MSHLYAFRTFSIGELRHPSSSLVGWDKSAELRPEFKPYPHQAESNEKFKRTGSVVLAHPVGSGKTFTAVHLAEDARKRGEVERVLVVVPTALRDNFALEGVKKFTDADVQVFGSKSEQAVSKDRVSLENADPGKEYSVVGYSLFRRNPEGYIKKLKPDMLILDEYHRAKDENSQTYQAIKRIRPYVDKFVGMTASLVSNDPSDIAPLVNLATMGQHPFSDRNWFKNRYEYTRGMERGFFGGEKKQIGLRRTRELRDMLSDVVHYVSPKDVAKNKPRREVVEVSVEMSPLQRRYYHYALGKLDPDLQDRIKRGLPPRNKGEARSMLRMLIDARRASNTIHPFNRFISPREGALLSPKIVKLLDDAKAHIKSTPDARVMMYTELVDGGMDALAAGLEERGIPFRVFAGKGREVAGREISDASRRKAQKDYIEGKVPVLLVSPSGAEGLNLHNTTMIQSLDAHFNPERIHQVEGRGVRSGGQAHRAPEDRVVQIRRYRSVIPPHLNFVDRLFGNDKHERTVDEWIYQTAAAKDRLNALLRAAMAGEQEAVDDPSWVFTAHRDLRIPPVNKVFAGHSKRLRQEEQADTLSGKQLHPEQTKVKSAPETPKSVQTRTTEMTAPSKSRAPRGQDGVRVYDTTGKHKYLYKIRQPSGAWEYHYE